MMNMCILVRASVCKVSVFTFFSSLLFTVKSFGVLTEPFLERMISFRKMEKRIEDGFLNIEPSIMRKRTLESFRTESYKSFISTIFKSFEIAVHSFVIYGVLIWFNTNQVCFLKTRLWIFCIFDRKKSHCQ